MGQVIAGAVLGALIGLGIGSVTNFSSVDLNFTSHVGGNGVIHARWAMQAFAQIVGTGAGAIVGAIAGATAARPDSKPLPRTFWQVLAILSVVVAVYAMMYIFAS